MDSSNKMSEGGNGTPGAAIPTGVASESIHRLSSPPTGKKGRCVWEAVSTSGGNNFTRIHGCSLWPPPVLCIHSHTRLISHLSRR